MAGVDMFLLIFIIIVALVGVGWFVYEANRDE